MLYWRIRRRLRVASVCRQQRAEYGRQIVNTVAADLTARYGRGYERTNLFRMMRFAEQFPDEAIVATASPQLSWSQFVALLCSSVR